MQTKVFNSVFASVCSAILSLSLVGCPRAPNGVPEGQDPEKVSRAEYDIAQDEWRHGRLRTAMEHGLRSVAADETYAEASHFVAILYLALCQSEGDCRLEDAENFARKSVVADAEYRPAKHTLGMILLAEKKFDEAIDVLRPLAEDIIYKTPELAWYDLGGAYLEKGLVDKAIDALSKAVALKPSFCWANYRLGLAYEQNGMLAQAEHELSKSVEPEEPACKNLQDAYGARGRVFSRMGKKEFARQDFELCFKLSASTPAGRACRAAL